MAALTGPIVNVLVCWATLLPLCWKWRLGLVRSAVATGVLSLLAWAFVAASGAESALGPVPALAVTWLLTLAMAGATLAHRFYRDPERTAPSDPLMVLSPADGEVIYVLRSADGVVPVSTKDGRSYRLEELTRTALLGKDAMVIGISLSFLDVHVNRAPIGGTVSFERRFPGSFGSLRRPEMALENERATIVIERDGLQFGVVMIASRLVRRIVAFVREGDELAPGQRIGVIRFGSQVDLVLPCRPGVRVTAQVGQRVRAGESQLARLGPLVEEAQAGRERARPAQLAQGSRGEAPGPIEGGSASRGNGAPSR